MSKKSVTTKQFIDLVTEAIQKKLKSEEVVDLNKVREFKKISEPKKILLVEDDETVRLATTRILEQQNYKVFSAADASGLSLAMEQAPDLILLDIGLPWLNGLEIGRLLQMDAQLKSIPLIYISASNSEMKEAFQIGASDFLVKPLKPEKLIKSIQVLLKLNAKADEGND